MEKDGKNRTIKERRLNNINRKSNTVREKGLDITRIEEDQLRKTQKNKETN